MAKIRCVKKKIKRLRSRLEILVNQRGVSSPETIRCSQQLDQAIMEFYRARRRAPSSTVTKFPFAAD